jgi:hypothetical protein
MGVPSQTVAGITGKKGEALMGNLDIFLDFQGRFMVCFLLRKWFRKTFSQLEASQYAVGLTVPGCADGLSERQDGKGLEEAVCEKVSSESWQFYFQECW